RHLRHPRHQQGGGLVRRGLHGRGAGPDDLHHRLCPQGPQGGDVPGPRPEEAAVHPFADPLLRLLQHHPGGTIMARVMSDTNRIGGVFAWSLVDIFWSAAYVIGSMCVMLFINWKLALLIIVVVPVIALLTL